MSNGRTRPKCDERALEASINVAIHFSGCY